jgi:hypothetical protein
MLGVAIVDMFKGFIRRLLRPQNRKQPIVLQQNSGKNPQQNELSIDLNQNLAVIQSIYQSCPDVIFRRFLIGGKTNAILIYVGYIEGITDETLIEEVTRRLEKIDIDGVLESGYIEELIEDNPWSPFPQVLNTERPDVVSASLLEGRVAILVDCTPFALIVPSSFYSLLQAAEDYYQRFIMATAIRWMRYVFFAISLILPSAYIAILTFHQEMVPTALVLSIAKARESVPFPALVETLLMEITFEALREA